MAGSSRLSSDLSNAAQWVAGLDCVVALSGGADSAALAWLCSQSAASVRAVHVNHSLPDSPSLEAAAKAVASRLGVELHVVAVAVATEGASWEAKARRARYEALYSHLRADEILVTGHTADDVAETMLINLGRGAGPRGLSGIPRRRGRVLRPLIGVRRTATRELAERLSIPFMDDPANANRGFLRNRVRHDLLADYERVLGRDPVPGMVRSAGHLADVADTISELAAALPVAVHDGVARVARARLQQLLPPVAAEVIRKMVTAARPPHPPTSAEVERIVDVVEGRTPVAELEGGLVATTSRAHLLIGPQPRPIPARSWDMEVVEFGGWTLRRRPRQGSPGPSLSSGMSCVLPDREHELTIRTVEPDDAFSIRGGTKSAHAAIAEAGVALPARSVHPVVILGGSLAWIPGVRAVVPGWEERAASGYLLLDVVEEGPWK